MIKPFHILLFACINDCKNNKTDILWNGFSRKWSNQHFPLCPPFIYRQSSDIQTFYHSRHTLAAGRIFGCEVQSPAVDAENFWDKGRTKRLFPMTGIFLSPLSKAYSLPKSLRHRWTAHPAPKNNFLRARAKQPESRGNKNILIMKFTVSSTAMANKLGYNGQSNEQQTALPILSTFLLEVKEDAPLE